MTDQRPKWPHKNMTEQDFRRLVGLGHVVSITAKTEMIDAERSREWLEATNWNGKTGVVPSGWKDVWEFVGYSSVPGLFRLNYTGQQMAKTLEVIDAWEAQNAADRAEFERLKAKFGDRHD